MCVSGSVYTDTFSCKTSKLCTQPGVCACVCVCIPLLSLSVDSMKALLGSFLLLSTHWLSQWSPHKIKNLPCSQHAGRTRLLARLRACRVFPPSARRLYVCQTISGGTSGVTFDQSVEVFTSVVSQRGGRWRCSREA